MADYTGQEPWSWVPDEWRMDPYAAPQMPDPLALTEYGLPSTGAGVPGNLPAPPPPPPPPPPVQRFGGQPPIEETAGPVPAAPAVDDLADVSTEPKWLTGADDPWNVGQAPPPGLPSFADESTIPQPPGTAPAGDERRGQQEVEANARAYMDDPLLLAEAERKWDAAKKNTVATRILEENQRTRQQMEQNYAAQQEARAQARVEADAIRQEAQDLANGKFGWSSKSTGQKFAGILAAVVGGLVAGRTGGPNMGLQMIEREIERDLQTRKDSLALRRGLLADKTQQADADLRTSEAQRLALYELAIRDVETQAQQFDPRGRAAMDLAKTAMGLRASQAKAMQDAEKRAFEQAKAAADLRKTLAEAVGLERKNAGIGMGGGGGGGAGTAIEKKVFTSEELAKQLPPGAWVPPKGWTGTLKDYGQLADAANKGQQVASGGAVGAEQRKTQRERVLPDVFNIDEKGNRVPFEPVGTDAEVADLRKRVAGTRKVVKMLDEALALRSGWTSNAGNSDENQRLKALMGAAKLAVKDADSLGQLTEGDLDLIVGRLGTDDFTQYRDFEAGVAQARKLLVDGARTSLVSQGLSPTAAAKWEIPNFYGAKHTTTPGEQTYKERQDQDKMHYGAEQPRDPETGQILFTGDLPAKPAPAYTLEAERLRRAKQARLWELEKEFGIGKVPRNAQGKVVDPKTGEVLE